MTPYYIYLLWPVHARITRLPATAGGMELKLQPDALVIRART